MENESADKNSQGLTDQVDSTGVMPAFDSGPSVHSMSQEDAAKEWQEMTVDKEGKYDHFPRSVFLKRLSALFEHGFGEKLKKQKEAREVNSQKEIDVHLDKIAQREEDETIQKAREINVRFFGSEKEAERVFEVAGGTYDELSEENVDFLKTQIPNSRFIWADSPFIISLLAGISEDADLIKSVNEFGLEKLVSVANKSGIFRRRNR